MYGLVFWSTCDLQLSKQANWNRLNKLINDNAIMGIFLNSYFYCEKMHSIICTGKNNRVGCTARLQRRALKSAMDKIEWDKSARLQKRVRQQR